VPGYSHDVHPAGGYLDDEQDVQPLQEDRVHGEQVTRQQALGLGAQESAPGRIQAARSGPVPAGTEDPPDSRLTDPVAEPGQLAVHPAISPRRVLRRQPQCPAPLRVSTAARVLAAVLFEREIGLWRHCR